VVNDCLKFSCFFYFFAGSDLVEWLFTHVEGFADRRDARKYACNLLKAGFIRHTVNKITFSEQCYYVFGDLTGGKHGGVKCLLYNIIPYLRWCGKVFSLQ